MGRPRRDSAKSDSGSTAGNVYNASLAAAVEQQQKALETTAVTNIRTDNSTETNNSTFITPQLEAISLSASAENTVKTGTDNIINTTVTTNNSMNTIEPITPNSSSTSTSVSPANIHRRSLSIAELVSLVSSSKNNSRPSNTTSAPHTVSSASALNALNLPEALRNTLEMADSPILNALLPLIRQKLAAKTAINRRNSAADASPSLSSASIESRRSSTSARSEDHRLSHKLAERKRRKEMKDVFDNLKDTLPPGVPKSSKWEILNEASVVIDELLAQEQELLNQRNQLLKQINNK